MFFLRDPLTEEVSGPFSVADVRQLYAKGGYDLWELSKSVEGPWTPINRVKGLASESGSRVPEAPSPNGGVAAPPQATIREDVVYCRVCGKQGAAHSIACLGCGVPPGVGDKYCNRCGVEVPHPQAVMCVKCGSALTGKPTITQSLSAGQNQRAATVTAPADIEAAAQSVKGKHRDYYKKVFTEINNEGGGFKAYWNWTSFFLGPLYFLYHGLIVKGIMLFVLNILFLPAGWAYAGIAFNYDLYLKKVKGKDLW